MKTHPVDPARLVPLSLALGSLAWPEGLLVLRAIGAAGGRTSHDLARRSGLDVERVDEALGDLCESGVVVGKRASPFDPFRWRLTELGASLLFAFRMIGRL